MEPAVRRPQPEDVPALAATLAAAFADYPWTRWSVDPDDHWERLRALYAIYLDVTLRFGEVWMSDDARAAAAWSWSEDTPARLAYLRESGLGARIAELAGARAPAGEAGDVAIERHAMEGPHWYLAIVAVAPDAQCRGLGTQVLAPMLERCDAEGLPAALDTSAPDNVGFYERLGFAVHAEADVPGGGPHLWFMRRDPGGRA